MIRRICLVWRATSKPKIRAVPSDRQEQRRQDLDERRLARAVRAEQAEELARLDLEVDAVEGDDGLRLDVVDAADAADVDRERRRAGIAGGLGRRTRNSPGRRR